MTRPTKLMTVVAVPVFVVATPLLAVLTFFVLLVHFRGHELLGELEHRFLFIGQVHQMKSSPGSARLEIFQVHVRDEVILRRELHSAHGA